MKFPRTIAAILSALTLIGISSPAFAQFRRVVPHEMVGNTVASGDHIRFCINSMSALAAFDRELGQRLADMLLVPAQFYDLRYAVQTAPWTYELTLGEEDLFIQMSNNCDALIGYPMPVLDVTYGWLTVTAPYYTPGFVIALSKDIPEDLTQLPARAEIGSRVGLLADMNLRAYLKTTPNNLKRRVFASNVSLIRALASGELAAAIVWEPAIAVAAETEPGVDSVRVIDAPFVIEPVELAIALPSNQSYLREMLNNAIFTMQSDGSMVALLSEYGLPEGR
jgi:ABC-type amino acid transport substrate-binding protein